MISLLLMSPNTASYTFVLLILPVALLLDEIPRRRWLWPLTAYVLLTLPLWPAWSWFFPKFWLLLILFLTIGYRELKDIRVSHATFAAGIILAIGVLAGIMGTRSFANEPARHFAYASVEPGAIFSSSPAPTAPAFSMNLSAGTGMSSGLPASPSRSAATPFTRQPPIPAIRSMSN